MERNCCHKPPGKHEGPSYAVISRIVKEEMHRLMPGWFTKMDEIMDPIEPFHSINVITDIIMRDPTKRAADVIHDHFRDDWFAYHADGDEDW